MSQSRHIANAIPITPKFNTTAKTIENISLTPIVVVIEIIAVNFTSPVARKPFPSGSANGNTRALKML